MVDTLSFLRRSAPGLLLVLLLAGCGARPHLAEVTLPPARSNHVGFSLVPLNEAGWLVLQKTPNFIAYGKRGSEADETYALQANTTRLPKYASPEEFYASTRNAPPTGGPPGRFRMVSYQSRPAPDKGEMCVRAHSVSEDHAPTRQSKRTDFMVIEAYSLLCVHPKSPPVGVVVTLSQRYYPGNRSPRLDKDAEVIFASVTLTDL